MEQSQVEAPQTSARRSSGDDPARFLNELRQLRDGAGLGPAELAARAHYPYDRIRAAEAGPALPDLPVLSAYVRGCGGTTEEWEERWRSLTSAPTLPLLAARPTGSSTAASAGARIGSISPAADTPDPSIILAALDRVAEGMAVGDPAPLPSRPGVATIEQRPGSAPGAPNSGGASPQAGEPAGASASVPATASVAPAGKPSVWETSTTQTANGTAAGPTARETDQTAAAAEPVTGVVEVPAAKAAEVSAAGAPAARRADATLSPALAARPTATRKTIAVLIALVICVIVAALAIFA
ncbi:MAG: helix-turn-helix domain-containing protein [Trebonia sp.]